MRAWACLALSGALSGLASTFTDEEVAQTIEIITSEEFVNRLIAYESFTNNVVVCNNDHAADLSNISAPLKSTKATKRHNCSSATWDGLLFIKPSAKCSA
ncbi:MAG: hypothetical protein R2911_21275 [Caldilineaceae bacterium]